ncbi:MAG: hypothetical protein WCE62_10065 [Polyangiales bacterium]
MTSVRLTFRSAVAAIVLGAAGCGTSTGANGEAAEEILATARDACVSSADYRRQACALDCSRRGDGAAGSACEARCDAEYLEQTANCSAVTAFAVVPCAPTRACAMQLQVCRDRCLRHL